MSNPGILPSYYSKRRRSMLTNSILWILQPTVDLRRKLIQAYNFHSRVNARHGVTLSHHFCYLRQILDDTDQKLDIAEIIHEIDPHGKLEFNGQCEEECTDDGSAYQKLCRRRYPLVFIFLYVPWITHHQALLFLAKLHLPCT